REVIASPQALLIGPILLPYRGRNLSGQPGRWIYDQDALTRFLLAHLPEDRRLPHPDLARAAIKRMPRWQKVLAGLAIAAWLAFELWRAFGR
ncbi:MAG TPA: hypothetical protein VLJ58_12285, partial [Ramlibacter sp.]|nr:hypothetical protein [Ramlibacter sp.]